MHITAAEYDTLRNGLEGAHVAVQELFAELGKDRVADWAILNDGLCAKDRALVQIRCLAGQKHRG